MTALLTVIIALAQPHAPLDLLEALQQHRDLVFHGPSACGCEATCADPDCGDCACAECREPSAPPPHTQLMVVHGLRVVQARRLAPLAETTDRLGAPDGLLAQASDLLRGGGPGDTPCCVRLVLDALSQAQPAAETTRDGSPLFTLDLQNGQKQLDRIHQALASRAQTAYYARSLLGPNRAGTLLGQGSSATGTLVIERDAGPSTWAHELGHLAGLGHYTDPARDQMIMYRYGDVTDPAGALSCRDCDYFRAAVPSRKTLRTVVSHGACSEPMSAGADGTGDRSDITRPGAANPLHEVPRRGCEAVSPVEQPGIGVGLLALLFLAGLRGITSRAGSGRAADRGTAKARPRKSGGAKC